MGFIHVAVAALGLLSAGHSAPVTNCESLTEKIEIQGREQLLGKWIYLAESTDIRGSKSLTKMFVESAWANITAADESDAMSIFQSQKILGHCFSLTSQMALENSTLSAVKPFNSSAVLLKTGCPDCLVPYTKYTIEGSIYSGLQLLSRREKVTDAELEEFTKQVECLNLPSAAVIDPVKGFCSDESQSQETKTIDLTSFMDSDISKLFDKLFSSESGVQMVFKMLSNGITGLKGN